MSAEEASLPEPIAEPTGVEPEATSSWPGVVRVETGLDDMRSFLGKERYHEMIAFMKGLDPDGSNLRRRMGGTGIHGAVGTP